jgi:hypothetical protein
MSRHIEQPWLTLEFDAANEDDAGSETGTEMEVIQPQDEWIDTQGYHAAALEVQMPERQNVALVFETGQDAQSPWEPLAVAELVTDPEERAQDQYSAGSVFTDDSSAPKKARFSRYIRWRAFASFHATGPWRLCARWVWVLKE